MITLAFKAHQPWIGIAIGLLSSSVALGLLTWGVWAHQRARARPPTAGLWIAAFIPLLLGFAWSDPIVIHMHHRRPRALWLVFDYSGSMNTNDLVPTRAAFAQAWLAELFSALPNARWVIAGVHEHLVSLSPPLDAPSATLALQALQPQTKWTNLDIGLKSVFEALRFQDYGVDEAAILFVSDMSIPEDAAQRMAQMRTQHPYPFCLLIAASRQPPTHRVPFPPNLAAIERLRLSREQCPWPWLDAVSPRIYAEALQALGFADAGIRTQTLRLPLLGLSFILLLVSGTLNLIRRKDLAGG